jgi:hypothetical protein
VFQGKMKQKVQKSPSQPMDEHGNTSVLPATWGRTNKNPGTGWPGCEVRPSLKNNQCKKGLSGSTSREPS